MSHRTDAERLVASACSSDPRRALALLARDPALARCDLACACVCGDVDEVARRVGGDPGVATRATGPRDWTPILYACFSRLGRGDAVRAAGLRGVVDVLLGAGADPDARFLNRDGAIQSTLYGAAGIAGDPALTATLLAAGADPDDAGERHRVGEALYHACEHADPECARLLVAAGTPEPAVSFCVLRALDFPREATVAVLCAGGARPGSTHLRKAILRRRGPGVVGRLLDAGAPVDGDALALAVRSGQDAVAALLLERGADASRVGDGDRALGAWLSGDGASGPPVASSIDAGELTQLLGEAAGLGDAPLVARLLGAGAPVDGGRGEAMAPLRVAAWHGFADVVATLVEHGAAREFGDGGTAVGAALHGSRHCGDPQGGPTMATVSEIDPGRYRETLRVLLAAGAPVPDGRIGERGPRAATRLAELGF